MGFYRVLYNIIYLLQGTLPPDPLSYEGRFIRMKEFYPVQKSPAPQLTSHDVGWFGSSKMCGLGGTNKVLASDVSHLPCKQNRSRSKKRDTRDSKHMRRKHRRKHGKDESKSAEPSLDPSIRGKGKGIVSIKTFLPTFKQASLSTQK